MKRTVKLIIFAGYLVLSIPANAALGGNVSGISLEQSQFGSQLSIQQQNSVTVYIQTLPTGTSLEEYADASGTIFALKWRGSSLPNFQIVLGAYFNDYVAAIQKARGPVSLNNENIILQSGGIMGAYQGFAYLPKRIPAGFAISTLEQ
jgi:hypothetical protein